MEKKLYRIFLVIAILLFSGFIFYIFNSIYGNPVSAGIATSKIRSYVKETYPDMDLVVPKAKYNFKFDEYYSTVKSKTSPDTYFTLTWSDGRIDDRYLYQVEEGNNTYQRLQTELSNTVEDIIQQEFPYETSILFADFESKEKDFSSLSLDMPLDIKNPPLPIKVIIYILSKEVSYEVLRDRLIELSGIIDKHNIPVSAYDIVIEEPAPEGEKAAVNGKSLYLYDFPAENLSKSDLIEIMKEHQKQWENQENHKK